MRRLKDIIVVIVSIFVVIGININIEYGIELSKRFNGNSIMNIIFVIMLVILLRKIIEIKDKRLIIISLILSIVYATIEIIGFPLVTYNNVLLPKSSFLKWIAYIVLFYSIIVLIFKYIQNYIETMKIEEKNVSKKVFFIAWIIIMLMWMPYFLKYYPGVLSLDSFDQISQGIDANRNINSHHPVVHTLFIKVCISIGSLFGTYSIGVCLYSIVQMLILSGIFAYTFYYMRKKKLPKIVSYITLIFYAIYPVFAMYSITMWKDILFGGVMLLYTICITELVINTDSFLKSIKKNIFFILVILGVMLLRNNGAYVILLSTPIIIIVLRKNIKRLLPIFIIPIVLYFTFTGPIYKLFNINKGSIIEALSIPVQQIARVVKENEIDENTMREIQKFMNTENISNIYNPLLADPVKGVCDANAIEQDKIGFVKIWFKLFLNYPKEYIIAFLNNSYGYWYPEARYWVYLDGINENSYNIEQIHFINIPLLEKTINARDIPIVSFLYSIGFCFWLILGCTAYILYNKRYKQLIIFLGVGLLWLTTLASPVFCEYRYVFSMFTCLPVLIMVLFVKEPVKS